ncbi:MAG: DMT family transporter [Treponema sp.]|jgi:drug/metabolite transporter (DMT)-like permease|nr:DMT family transporter [Treponema sp.]
MSGCVLCWSTGGLFIALLDWHPMTIACIRSGIAALFMAAVRRGALFQRREGRAYIFGVPALAVAAAASAATKILFVTANKMTAPANAILLQHSAPVWAALFARRLTGEELTGGQRLAVLLGTAGAAVFLFDGLRTGMLAGDGVALLSGLTFALSMTALRAEKEGSPALALFFSHLVPAALGIPFLIIAPPRWTPVSAAAALLLGLGQIGAASLLYAYAIKRLQAVNVMLIAQTEPVLAALWVFAVTGAAPSVFALWGGLIIIAAAVAANKGPR